jgi:hypothetical protein
MIIANSLTALVYLIAGGKIKSILPNAPTWALATLVVTSVSNVFFAVALFKWKKWGFFGFVGTTRRIGATGQYCTVPVTGGR